MMIFWTLAAGLTLLAILFVVLPLLRPPRNEPSPDQDTLNLEIFRRRLAELDADLAVGQLDRTQYDAARHDLERELLHDLDTAQDRAQGGPGLRPEAGERATGAGAGPRASAGRAPWLAAALAVALPAGAVLAYLQLGDVEMVSHMETAAALPAGHPETEGPGMPPLKVLVEGLAAKMEANPDNLEGWLMLGRSYVAIGQPGKAQDALERAYRLAPKDATVLVAYAEALAANGGNSLAGRPAELIRTALELDPGNTNARMLNGMLAYQEGRFADAATAWERILAELDPRGQDTEDMQAMIAEARRRAGAVAPASEAAEVAAKEASPDAPAAPPGEPRLAQSAQSRPEAIGSAPAAEPAEGGPAPASGAPAASDRSAATGATAIRVSVALAPELAAQAPSDATVFVFARAAAGPPMPLAAKRLAVSELPATLTLDDSMAMAPGMSLSAFPRILVGARVSKTGRATPASGDLEGVTGPLDSGAQPAISVIIDRVRP